MQTTTSFLHHQSTVIYFLLQVTVAVRLKPLAENATNSLSSYITADPCRGQLILRDPSNESNMAPSCRRQLAAVPKFFAFDTVFGGDAMQVCVNEYAVLKIREGGSHVQPCWDRRQGNLI